MDLSSEIFEQPTLLALLNQQRGAVEAIARELASREIDYLFLAARGTLENAGIYA